MTNHNERRPATATNDAMYNNLIELLMNSADILDTGAELTAYYKNSEPQTEAEKELFKTINRKYCNDSESENLLITMFVYSITPEQPRNNVFLKVDSLKKLYSEGGESAVIKTVLDNIKYALFIRDQAEQTTNALDTYKGIKDRLIIRPLNYDNNVNKLENTLYKRVDDIALTVYAIVLDDRENGILNTIKIPLNIIETWEGVTPEEVYTNALENTAKYYNPRLYTDIFNIETAPFKECALMSKGYTVKELNTDTVALLTTDRKTNGAIATFLPGTLERISELYGDSDFYIAFTSIHEAMTHKKGSIKPEAIKRNVTETNRIFGGDETLSNKVWLYSAEDKTLTAVL